jgi:hypothetical protein
MPPKRTASASAAKRGSRKRSTPLENTPSSVSTPLKKSDIVEVAVSTASTVRSTLSRSTLGSPGTISLTKINFKDMVAAEEEGVEEKLIKAFDGWLVYQSVLKTVKTVFPHEPGSKWRSMSYEDLVTYLLLYLEVDDSKTVFFNFAVNIHGMSGVDIFERLKTLKTAVEVADAFVALLNSLLDKEENSVYVNDEEVSVAKSNVSTQAKKTLLMETPEMKKPPARRVQTRRAAKKAPVIQVASPSKTTDVVIKKEKIDCENVEVIELTDNGDDAVDPMNMTVYNDVVSNTAKYSSPKNAKKCIQVFISNLFRHKTDDDKNVYAVMTNFRECVWYMKSDFLVSCLVGMEKTALFMMEYKDVDMSWIDQFTDFSIRAVEHGIDKYKKSKTGKTMEMVLLPVTLFNDDDEVSIEDQVRFIFEDVLRRVFRKYKVGGISRGKMLLDFLETKSSENFLNFLVKSKGSGNRVFAEECITEELNHALYTTPFQYNWNVALDKFMMNSDIKLFLMGLGYTSFDDLNEKEIRACFEYAGTSGYKVPVWGEVQKQAYND